jgi:peptide/nickel transport system ATP-binding protein
MPTEQPVLSVQHLQTYFAQSKGQYTLPVVDDVSFDIHEGTVLGLVGESGCGKSMTALSIMRLLPQKVCQIMGGNILLEQHDLLSFSEKEMEQIRGNQISMIFQEPMTALNPVFPIGSQMKAILEAHTTNTLKENKEWVEDILHRVQLPDPVGHMNEYPHQLSGGMKQRVLIGMALLCNPLVILADEPTTALDVTIQDEIIQLLRKLKEEDHLGMLFISHDLGVISQLSDKIAVMYAGQIVEYGSESDILTSPMHPYTQGLLQAMPQIHKRTTRLHPIAGRVIEPSQYPIGCRFQNRCSHKKSQCTERPPGLTSRTEDHFCRCWVF